MNAMRFLITCAFLVTYAAYAADTFVFPPYIEVPCYQNQNDQELRKQPFSTVVTPFWPSLTLRHLQELIRDQKGPGFLMFDDKKIDDMGQVARNPLNTNIGDFDAFEIFVDSLYFVLANQASPAIGTNKNH